jgi:hypothetical protein
MRDKAKRMPFIAEPAEVDSLRIWHCGYETLKAIERFRGVRSLVIATFPDQSLECLASLRDLRYLHIEHLPRIGRHLGV